MPNLFIVTREGVEHEISAPTGSTIMEAIRNAGIDEMLALCGGCCSCATCHVHIDARFEDKLPVMSKDEDDLLDSTADRDDRSRLSCQIEVTEALDGLRATIAAED